MWGPASHAALVVTLIASGFGLGSHALAQQSAGGMQTDYPIPSTAREAYSPIGEGFTSPIESTAGFIGSAPYTDEREAHLAAKRQQRDLAPFFRDTAIKAHSRTFWFDEDSFGYDEPKVLTTGGHISYQSGFIADFLQLRGAVYTSQPLYAGEDAADSLNLLPDGNQITTLGQINTRMKFAHQELIVGRQLVRTPYINPFDIRMIPLSFEGVVLLPERKGQQPLDYIASYLWQYKPLNYANFISFSEGLGVDGHDEGVFVTGIRRRTDLWNYGFTNYWIKDTLNTFYTEVDYLLPFGGGEGEPSFRVSVNDLDQRSVGDDLLTGSSFHTHQASARLIGSYQNFVLTGAVSVVGDGSDIYEPFGFNPDFTSMLITTFDRAGERAFLVTLSYDFSKLGLEGVKFHVGWGRGIDAIDADTGDAEPDEDELDLLLVYEPHRGRLQGLQVKVEYIDWRMFDTALPSEDLTQFRAIVNYTVPLL